MEVRDGMSTVVLTVGPGLTLREAAQKMAERKVGSAVVIDEEMPGPGIVSERDILISVGNGQDPDSERVADHQNAKLISASPDWSLERAAHEMSRRRVRHLVVIEHGECIGVLSIRDIVAAWMSDGATSGTTSPESEATPA